MRSIASALVILVAAGLGACHKADDPLPLGAPCDGSRPCAEDLLCSFERCRRPCDDARPCAGDCGAECTCFEVDDVSRACELPGDTCADGASCPPPLLCGPGDRCTLDSFCGDGVWDDGRGEECDDQNTASNDGCGEACNVESGWECDVEVEPSVCQRICGNGHLDLGEACDDDNTFGSDGCGEECEVEEGWDCDASEPSECWPASDCGDEVIGLDEQCDGGDNCDDCQCPHGRFGDGCAACVRLVDPDSADERQDGHTWATAFRSIQDAIDDAARAGADELQFDGSCDVWVREGSYKVVTPTPDEERGSYYLELPPGVRLIGGFKRGATTIADSAPRSNRTTLDGDGSAEHVVIVHQSLDSKTYREATIEGFVITGGKSTSTGTPTGVGAGVLVYQENTITTIRRCEFYDNRAGAVGGGLGVESGAAATVENCLFRENRATTGGGIGVASQSRLRVVSSTFYLNEADFNPDDSTGGAGVGIASVGPSQANPHVSSCILSDLDGTSNWLEEVFARADSPTKVDVDHSYFVDVPRPAAGDNWTGAQPLVIDEGSPDFLHLLSSTGAIDTGARCVAPPFDMAGAERADVPGYPPDGSEDLPPPDMGAFEFPGRTESTRTWREECSQPIVPDGGTHSYWFVPNAMPWPRARDTCVASGGHLVTFDDAEELTAIIDALSEAAPELEQVWVGGVAVNVDGALQWTWVNEAGEEFPGAFDDWGWESTCSVPRAGEVCMRLSRTALGTCNAACGEWRAFICEQG
jgi:cysteine-rich repeat protein